MRTPHAALLSGLVVASLLAACGQKEPKTVAYYTSNPAERDALLAECKNNPGKYANDPDCMNASDSRIQQWGKGTLPPVTFGTPASAAASK